MCPEAVVFHIQVFLFYAPNFEKLRGHIGLIMSVCLSVRYAFLRTRYLKNRVRYGADIWYTVSLPYEDMLINFKGECIKYCQSYSPFCENKVPIVSREPLELANPYCFFGQT